MVVRSAPCAERRCGAFTSSLNRLPTISELSNARVASIRTFASIRRLVSAFARNQLAGSAIEMSALGQKQTCAMQRVMSA
jgi:hypothetical protein